MPQYWNLDDDDQLRMFLAHRSMLVLAGKRFKIEVVSTEEKTRTPTQNRCMHQWAAECAMTLEAAGFDLKETLRQDAEIPVTKTNFLENVWRPVQLAITGEESTTKPTTVQYQKIYDVITRHISTTLGITLPAWPSYHRGDEDE